MGRWEGGKMERWEGEREGRRTRVVAVDLEMEEKSTSVRLTPVPSRGPQDGSRRGWHLFPAFFSIVCSHRLHMLGCFAFGSVSHLLFQVVLVCMLAATDSVLRTGCTVFRCTEGWMDVLYSTPYIMAVDASGARVVEICSSLVASELVCGWKAVSPPWAR